MTDRTDTGLSPLTLALCAATVVGALALAPGVGTVAPSEPETSLAATAALGVDDATGVDALDIDALDIDALGEPQVLGRRVTRDGEIVLGQGAGTATRGRWTAPSRTGRTATTPADDPAVAAAVDSVQEDEAKGCGADCGVDGPDGAPDAGAADDGPGPTTDGDLDAGRDPGGSEAVTGVVATPHATDAAAQDDPAGPVGEHDENEQRDKSKKTKKTKKPKKHEQGDHRGDRDDDHDDDRDDERDDDRDDDD